MRSRSARVLSACDDGSLGTTRPTWKSSELLNGLLWPGSSALIGLTQSRNRTHPFVSLHSRSRYPGKQCAAEGRCDFCRVRASGDGGEGGLRDSDAGAAGELRESAAMPEAGGRACAEPGRGVLYGGEGDGTAVLHVAGEAAEAA